MSSSTNSTNSNQPIQSTKSSKPIVSFKRETENFAVVAVADAINQQLDNKEAARADSLLDRLARTVTGRDKAVEINGNRYELRRFVDGKCFWSSTQDTDDEDFSLFGRLCVFHALCSPRSDGYKFEIESLDKMHIKISVWNEGPRFPRCVPASFILKQVDKSKRKWDEIKQRSKDDLDCLFHNSKRCATLQERKDLVDMLRQTIEKIDISDDVDCLSPGNDDACPYCDPAALEEWFRLVNRNFPGRYRFDKWKQSVSTDTHSDNEQSVCI